jgi:hypothetical protein
MAAPLAGLPKLIAKVDNKVRFVSAYLAYAGLALLFLGLARRRLHFDHLTGDSHFRFIAAFVTVTLFNSFVHGGDPLNRKIKISINHSIGAAA